MINNIINNIINAASKSNFTSIRKIGQTLNLNQQMRVNKDAVIRANRPGTSIDRMQDILREMKSLLNGGYYGNKEYLFSRLEYLINCAAMQQFTPTQKRKTVRVTVAARRKKLPKRNKKGQFASTKRRRK